MNKKSAEKLCSLKIVNFNVDISVSPITIYHNTDYINKGRSSLFRRKKTCRLNVVNFNTLDLKSRLLIIIFVISNKNLNC